MSKAVLLLGLLQAPAAGAPDPSSTPPPTGDRFAISIAAGQDLNGDRIPDLVIADATPFDASVWIVSGRHGSVVARWRIPDGHSTWSVDLLGDIDRDGSSELAVLASRYQQPGCVMVLSGRTRVPIRTLREADLGVLVGAVRAAGSVDEDGCPDLIVAGRGAIDSSTDAGSALVVSGKDGRVIWRLTDGNRESDSYVSVAGVGDLDADDRDDIAVGWRRGPRGGRVVLYSGKTGLPMRVLLSEKLEYDFGHSLDGGVDFDGDLRPDLLVGSPDLSCPAKASGYVRVYSGRDGSLLRTLDGIDFPRVDGCGEDSFGECARFVRDVDGDRVPELLVGAPEKGLFEGSAYLCSGKTGSILLAIEGRGQPSPRLPDGDRHVGRALGSAGDVDRDGVEDFAVANVPYDCSQRGLVRVFSGKTGKLLLSIDRNSLLRAAPPASAPR